jgi:transcription antitermination protein NusB
MGMRRRAREASLQLLYEIDLGQKDAEEILSAQRILWQRALASEMDPEEDPSEIEEFVRQIVEGVSRNVREIDRLIESHSTHWKISRMAIVDRNILRMAVFEILYCKDIPPSVSINEAIEIGKRYGTDESGAFINGVLDHIAKDLKTV